MSKINSNGYLMDCMDNNKEVSDETLMAYGKKEMATEQYHNEHIQREESKDTILGIMESIIILLRERERAEQKFNHQQQRSK